METYEERIPSIGILLIIFAVVITLVGILIKLYFDGSFTKEPTAVVIVALSILFFIIMMGIFREVKIKLTNKGITVGYGIFKSFRHWKDILYMEEDEKHWFYGYGIRLGSYKGRWVWVYNVINCPRVVFMTRKGMGLIASSRLTKRLVIEAKKRIST